MHRFNVTRTGVNGKKIQGTEGDMKAEDCHMHCHAARLTDIKLQLVTVASRFVR